MGEVEYTINDCYWNFTDLYDSWRRMYPSALDGNLQWISDDPQNNDDELKVLACLRCGCINSDRNNCLLRLNDIAILVKNELVTLRRTVYVALQIIVKTPCDKVRISGSNVKTFRLKPILGKHFSKKSYVKKSYVNSQTAQLTGISSCKGLDIIVNLVVLRDTNADCHLINKSTEIDWKYYEYGSTSPFDLIAHIL